jgi:dienelactone hydrolase
MQLFKVLAGLAAIFALQSMAMPPQAMQSAAAAEYPDDPLFDFKQIIEEPLDAKVLAPVAGDTVAGEKDGIVVERVEYTSMVRDGQPDRVEGIISYPKGGRNLPAIFWSQGGMAAASDVFPRIFAGKGYVCLNITLNHKLRHAFGRFDTGDPKNANLTRLTIDQLRGITYLAQRPEVDKDRIGVGGASYGGFFSTLIAGADPRVKAGMSFFAGGHHELGTNLPQFTALETADDIAVWKKTIDPAWRLSRKSIPFIWGIPSNDNWFNLPAVVKTYEESRGDKRAIIWPQWQHGFPPQVDNALIDWFDIYLKHTRKPYNQAGPLQVRNDNGRLIANWTWSGDNPVKKAELIVAYGPSIPWHGWVYRHHAIFPATVVNNSASTEIPLPEKDLEAYVYGNITDDHDVTISTVPVAIKPAQLGITKATAPQLTVNGAFYGDFEPAGMTFLQGCLGITIPVDTQVKHSGAQSLRIEATASRREANEQLKLGFIPEHSHVLKLWLRSNGAATARITVTAPPPANWKSKVVDLPRREAEAAAGVESKDTPLKAQEFSADVEVGTDWKQYTLPVPYDGTPVEGYNLSVRPAGTAPTIWMDDVTFEPVWK